MPAPIRAVGVATPANGCRQGPVGEWEMQKPLEIQGFLGSRSFKSQLLCQLS